MCSMKCTCADSSAFLGAGAVRIVHCVLCSVLGAMCCLPKMKIEQSERDELDKKKNYCSKSLFKNQYPSCILFFARFETFGF